jgi:hypothetical protein
LSRGFHQSFPPWAKDVAAVEFQLPAQFLDGQFVLVDGLLVLVNSLSVKLCRFIERGLEVFDLLTEPAQQIVTLLRISRP